MEAVIRKWGNSPALRLPGAVLKEAGYQLEQKVELIVSRGRIIIQPSGRVEYDLDALIGVHLQQAADRRCRRRAGPATTNGRVAATDGPAAAD